MPRLWWFAGGLLCMFLAGINPTRAWSQEPFNAAEPDDEGRDAAIAARFLSILQENPRRGTALNRVYGHHVAFGTLDAFLDDLRRKTTKSPVDGTAWMLLGLFESHRGETAHAVDAFRNAERLRPDDALASYYLAQSLLLIGEADEAISALERAIDRKPARSDLLDVFQQLGRVHQRAQRTDEAMAVWQRLENLFPDDPRVQEQIAVTMVEEGQYGLALPRYEKLAQLVKDDYRRVMFQIEAAELKIRENRRQDGINDLERILMNLNPDSWLYRDVRRRIEDIFLLTSDQDGLVQYYESWLKRNPDDVDAMARLAQFLASTARMPEATAWMEKALQRAPNRSELRMAFIKQLVDEQRYADAIAEYARLAESDPANVDILRDWGKLVLRDTSKDLEQRKAEAAGIWKKILEVRPDDVVTVSQVADLFRQANLTDEAIALYQKAIDIAPDQPQYREYLGQYYHSLNRRDEALATWRTMADGPRRTAANLARLAEVYQSFGYIPQAAEEIAVAAQLDPKNLQLALLSAEYHSNAGKIDQALEWIDAAGQLAANDDERESVLNGRLAILQTSARLADAIERLASALNERAETDANDWYTLARYFEAERRWQEATDAIGRALARDQSSIAYVAAAARIAEQAGDFARSADLHRQLTRIDRRSRSDHWMNVARLESQLGHKDQALQAGQQLIAAAPRSAEGYEFYAQLCFQLGEMEDGLAALRTAVRINPTEPQLTMALASALAGQLRTDEAIEFYWRAFEQTDEIDDKTTLVMKLTNLYMQLNQFETLIERLESERQEDAKRREMTICLAQAHHTSGDLSAARLELERLIHEETQDTNLLQQLSKLCEEDGELHAAINYQRRLVDIAPGHETEYRLALLLQQQGDHEEASDILVKLARQEENPVLLLRSLDSLLTQGQPENVVAITKPLLGQQRDNWELLYREAVAWAYLGKPREATERLRQLLSIDVPHETLAVERVKQEGIREESDSAGGLPARSAMMPMPLLVLGAAPQVLQAVGLAAPDNYHGDGPRPSWTPDSFGLARMAAYGWLLKFEQGKQNSDRKSDRPDSAGSTVADSVAAAAADDNADRARLLDWIYVALMSEDLDSLFDIAKRLALTGKSEDEQFLLAAFQLREAAKQQIVQQSGDAGTKGRPVDGDDLDLIVQCYRNLQEHESVSNAPVTTIIDQSYATPSYGTNIASPSANGSGSELALRTILDSLERAGRDDRARELLDETVARSKTPEQLADLMRISFARKELDRLHKLYPRWIESAKNVIAKTPSASVPRSAPTQLTMDSNFQFILQWMGQYGPDERHAEILDILDPALDLAVEAAQFRRASKSRRPTPATPLDIQRYVAFYGTTPIYLTVEFPSPSVYADAATLTILRGAYEIFTRNDVANDFIDHLRTRVENSHPDNLPYNQLFLGSALWWNDEREEALEVLTRVSERFQDDPTFQFEIGRLYDQLGDADRAFDIVDSVTRQAADHLFRLRSDRNSQLALVEPVPTRHE